MFDVGASELLMIVIVAVVVIGPKDMPLALRTAGRWIGKMRKISNQFRAGIDAMVREAELEEMEKKWREQNEAIMKSVPQLPTADEMQAPIVSSEPEAEMTPLPAPDHDTPEHGTKAEPDAAASPEGDTSTDDKRQAELNLPPPPP